MDSKACTKCGAVKPLSEFYKKGSGRHGLMAHCKKCHNRYVKKTHITTEQKKCTMCLEIKPASEFGKRPRVRTEYTLRSHCKKCEVDAMKRRYKETPDFFLEKAKKYREENKEAVIKRCQEWREKNQEWIKDYSKKCYEKDRDVNIERVRDWYKNNTERAKKNAKKNTAKARKELRGDYIKKLLIQKSGFTPDQITPELIELKKEQLEMVRLSRQLKKAVQQKEELS